MTAPHGWRVDPYVSRREALGAAKTLAEEVARLQKELAGAAMWNYILVMNRGGEVKVTQQDIIDSTGCRLQVSHTAGGEYVLTAIPDPTQPHVTAMTEEDVAEYERTVKAQEAAHANGSDRAVVEGDNIVS